MFTAPTVAQFQAQFIRDFPYGTDPNVSVLPTDITGAFNMVEININPALFCNQNAYTLGFLFLAAHYLVLNLRNSSQGLNGQYNFLQVSKNVAQVAEAFSIPQRILDVAEFSMYCKTNYGAQYLSWVLPQLTGNIFNACGTTQA